MSANCFIYEFADFQLDPLEKKLFRDKEEIVLEGKEFEVLLLLVKNAGTALKKEFILSEVWGDLFVEESAVTVRISNLRKKLDHLDRKKFIKTEKKGYRFIVKVYIVEKPIQTLISRKAVSDIGENELEFPTFLEGHYSSAHLESAFSEISPDDEQNQLHSYLEPNFRQRVMFGVVAALILTFGLILLNYALLWRESKKPRLKEAVFVTEPVSNNQFFMRLTGENLNPEMVSLKVKGPGCGGDNPCTVSNGPLRLFGQISELAIEKAPLTLARGEYHIWLENEPGNISNKVMIIIPNADQE